MHGLRQGYVSALILTMSMPVWAVDGISLTAGHWGHTDAHAVRIAAQWDWLSWPKDKAAALSVFWDTSFAYLGSNKYGRDRMAIWAGSPVVRFSIKNPTFEPYAEVGIGAAFLQKTRFAHRNLSTQFQFEDRGGVGARLYNRYEVSVHYRHYSNCGIKNPNNGIDLYTLTAAYRF